MSKRLTRLAGLLALLPVFALGPVPATASAAPGPCLDNGVDGVVTGSPANVLLPSASGTYTTTKRCRDINFILRSSSGDERFQANIRVCFVRAGYCQSAWKYYYDDENNGWMVIASNVKDGTTFRLEFQFYEPTFGSTYWTSIAF
ncbi:hypothetical protein [Lentzea aerocolonigenes]|uniref:hypothetical protein n=1 Tax=Lentzea aerocolonigenes TaxID=68170 RepID=UPI0004C42488|nr:hypothetical protein [Lentzea aerocolonigenes]MCP2250659.1 hypothetical protein [Lentzea aerocolonigenes]